MAMAADDNNSDEELMEEDTVNDGASDEEGDHMEASSEEDSDNDADLEQRYAELEERVKENVYNYNLHLELIKVCEKLTDFDKLKKVRQRMSEIFPLTPALWMSWLQNEKSVAVTDEEKKAVVELFERAVKDYQSVELWIEYADFLKQLSSEEQPTEDIRAVYEKALTSVGLHVARGSAIWDAYMNFEKDILASFKEKGDQSSPEYSAQLKRVLQIYKRRLSCPLNGMDNIHQEMHDVFAKEYEVELDPVIELGFRKALAKLEKVIPYEELLVGADGSEVDLEPAAQRLSRWRDYLSYEASEEADPGRIQCLYERALSEGGLCLEPTLWLEYTEWADCTLGIGAVALPVCERAVRNCPWNSLLWIRYLRASERYSCTHEEIKGILERALASGFSVAQEYRDLWMTYIDYLKRRLRKWDDEPSQGDTICAEHKIANEELRNTFDRACSHLAEFFGLEGDPACQLLQYWARIEANQFGDMEKTRLLWNDILSIGHDKSAQMWLEYIRLERTYGDSKHLRRLYSRALASSTDWPETIGESWLAFERDEGTLETLELCENAVRMRIEKVVKERAAAAAKAAEAAREAEGAKKAKRKGFGGEKNKSQEKFNAFKMPTGVPPMSGVKRRREEGEIVMPSGTLLVGPKGTSQGSEPMSPDGNHEDDSSAPKKAKGDGVESSSIGPVIHNSSKDDRTVFVSNLDYSIPEELIKETLSKCGTVTDIRLVKDFKGRSKGYCYVEFSSLEEAGKALEMDREILNGRPMFISKCDPDRQTRQVAFRYSTELEKNKLFVKGLPLSSTKEDLKNLFSPYGTLKDVRLVTYRNGHSKGLAYVDFEDEAAAAHALIKTDGMEIDGHTISVAISKPPERKQSMFNPNQGILSLGGGSKEVGARGRGRTQVSVFVPRSVQLHSGPSESSVQSETSTSSSSQDSSQSSNKTGMSNADFRQMLMAGKK
ncbi:squamous cell carcinoma antigen recognized by T-cells 3 [Ischnura elegans]|uniref:squamous cell carcinoma antigen recognized by T-cells 3 n=1 Tax=Ischnura elegans TaxID=197161 RepID=UPI001ED87623|nr:squamous cell carcinoma antigen recognized by T-cells 3 [Ischnura elegans]